MDEEDILLNELDFDINEPGPSTSAAVTDPNQELPQSTKREITSDLFGEFLQVAIHQILYARGLYPRGIFVQRKKYGALVYMSCHPGVNEYIRNVVQSIKPMVLNDVVPKVVLVVQNHGETVEQFMFEINYFSHKKSTTDHFLMQLEEHLRSAILKIHTCEAVLGELPETCTFEVQVHIRGSGIVDLLHCNDSPVVWVESEDQLPNDAVLTPLKSIADSPLLNMQLLLVHKNQKS